MKAVWSFFKENLIKLLGEERAKPVVEFAKSAWEGKLNLWSVFWIYGLLVPVVLSVLVITPLSAAGGRLGMSIALLLLAPYAVWILKSIWACSANLEDDDFHGVDKVYVTYVAKAYVVMGALQYFLALFG